MQHGSERTANFLNIEAFHALSFLGNRQFQNTEGESSQENAHACRLSTPRQGVSISDEAWEWTVYSVLGVWRCLREDRQEHCSTSSFFIP